MESKTQRRGDAETRRYGDTERVVSNVLVAASPARRVAASLLLMAVCLLSACRPDTSAPIKADATAGYCPVCHMKVKASDDWTAEIYYADGTKLMFESPGDLLAFYSAPNKYPVTDAQKDRANITKIGLQDYPSKAVIDGRQARLVYNSKLEGPMGADFFPFGKRADAEAFVAANGGKIVGLEDVSSELVQSARKTH